MTQVIFSAKRLKIIEANDGKKYLAGMEITGDSETSEQRRIAALEQQVLQLSAQLSHLQANQERLHLEKVRNSVIDSLSRALDHQFGPKRP